MSSDAAVASTDSIRSANWQGQIPVVVTLAPTSLSSPTLPPPIHVLVSRNTYLHVGLQTAVLRLHEFAPTTLSFASGMVQNEPSPGGGSSSPTAALPSDDPTTTTSSPNGSGKTNHHRRSSSIQSTSAAQQQSASFPVCWFEDETTQMALRWHLFVGVLYDLKRDSDLPWRIRLHFTQYPSSQLLQLPEQQVQITIQSYYKNSFKQALCLQYGNSKAAMNVPKESHERLWEALSNGNYRLYDQVHQELPTQQSQPQADPSRTTMIPVRLYVNARPPIQRMCKDYDSSACKRTLGNLLMEWIPDYFAIVTDEKVSGDGDGPGDNEAAADSTAAANATATNAQPLAQPAVRALPSVVSWRVGGIQPPLEASLLDVWKMLMHPDHFLYITVITN